MMNTNKELHTVTITFLVEGDVETAEDAVEDVARYISEIADLTKWPCHAGTQPIAVEQAAEQFDYEEDGDDDEEDGTSDQPQTVPEPELPKAAFGSTEPNR